MENMKKILIDKNVNAKREQKTRQNSVKAIIGRENMGDILHVETAIKEKMNHFITNDKDILNKRTTTEFYLS